MKISKSEILLFIGLFFICLVLSIVIIQIYEIKFNKDILEESFQTFHQMPSDEFHIKFHKKFHDSIYVLDCRVQYNEYNCSIAVLDFLKDMGANINFVKENKTYMNTNEIEKLLMFHSFKLQSITGIKGKELIIFKPDKNEIPHIAFVEKRNHTKRIFIMEMNARYGGINYRWIDFYDKRIKGIYPITYGTWRGEESYKK